MDESIFLSACIVTYNDGETAVSACKNVLNNTKKYPLRLYVTDNASADDTPDIISGLDLFLTRNIKNSGFGAAHNQVLNENMGKYHFVVNPDIEFSGDLISDMADFMEQNPDVVLCMPSIANEDGTVQYLPKKRPTAKRLFLGRFSDKIRNEYTMRDTPFDTVTDIDFCSGCFLCVRTEVFKALGGFDERFFMYLEDADLTLRAKKYGRTVIAPQFCVVHKWRRASAKKLKYLLIHTASAVKFLLKRK